ncbi:hypothetical protein M404DRAFT_36739 [Pisolithus tinctorius Marx 270]|uniref:Alpha-ketoglutarate-dependent dioxygenase AlkB-like domain-containing protein n=1 Tax=Pisolithus tinctorius Marx 270 TaxID=870435 RepID=A0A0C3N9V6_PISTI|nr:hypothetical protein M404DRAFT_36739 [Pisolithus tinctorius Marx 270]
MAGEPYKYVGGTSNTVPLSETLDCIREALDLIKQRAHLVVNPGTQFNEVLTATYLEGQKMSYHSDDEKRLGPIIASLSLGSPATMHFRRCAMSANRKEIALSLIIRHGDVLIMEGHDVQSDYD